MDNLDKSQLLLIGYELLGNELFRFWSCYCGNGDAKQAKVKLIVASVSFALDKKNAVTLIWFRIKLIICTLYPKCLNNQELLSFVFALKCHCCDIKYSI